MWHSLRALAVVVLASGFTLYGQQQTDPHPQQHPSAGHDVGTGTGDIAKGAGKGAGHIAEGAGKGAVDVVTLHPINGAAAVGKGAAVGGKDVAVGAGKGTGKVVRGTGKALKKVF